MALPISATHAGQQGAIPEPDALPIATIPAGTSARLRVESPVSSKTALKGDKFDISLAEDIVVDGKISVAAGAKGKGEVIHAQGKGFGGRAGELLLAARYLEVQGRQLKLRGFAISKAGANNTAEAIGASIAIPLAGLFVTGTSAEVKVGHLGIAKTVDAFQLQPEGRQPARSVEINQ